MDGMDGWVDRGREEASICGLHVVSSAELQNLPQLISRTFCDRSSVLHGLCIGICEAASTGNASKLEGECHQSTQVQGFETGRIHSCRGGADFSGAVVPTTTVFVSEFRFHPRC